MGSEKKSFSSIESSFWSGKKVIVTGGAGFLGNYVVEKLRQRGAEEIVIPRIEQYNLTEIVAINRLFDDHGMLFIYPTPGPRTFWMKDTFIPLSIAFLDDNGRIISIQRMAPMQTDERYRSLQPVRYALEVNRGWFADHGIGIGNIVEMKLPAMIEIK